MDIQDDRKKSILVPTGIKGLDMHLGGGFPPGSTILLVGDSGSGLPMFTYQFAYGGILNGDSVVYYTTDRPVKEIKSEMQSFSMDASTFSKQIEYVDSYTPRFYNLLPANLQKEMKPKDYLKQNVDVLNFLKATVLKERSENYRFIIDSVSYFLRSYSLYEIVDMIEIMSSVSKINQSVNILTMKGGMHDSLVENTMKHSCDGVIEFRLHEKGFDIERSMFIRKIRGMLVPSNIIPYRITRKGIELETTKRVL